MLAGDEERVLGVARRVVGRKVQRLEVVVVGLDLRAFAHRVAHGLEDGDDLVQRADDRVLGADGAANAGEGDVEAVKFQRPRGASDALARDFEEVFGDGFQFVDVVPRK